VPTMPAMLVVKVELVTIISVMEVGIVIEKV
jgi:hypothetical protein